ncbi:hypothetical protein HZH68_013520 [Vespula germanica]|uniref:Uncharacterized protein n=1 Tax=Vespula germanica TaxID=30212 RepID=A0A834MX67_VESGE|nr:hypothetical protein HZH68_013520 [Vespula germanica]
MSCVTDLISVLLKDDILLETRLHEVDPLPVRNDLGLCDETSSSLHCGVSSSQRSLTDKTYVALPFSRGRENSTTIPVINSILLSLCFGRKEYGYPFTCAVKKKTSLDPPSRLLSEVHFPDSKDKT